MELEDGLGQGPDGPVSFMYSFSFPWPSLIHLGQDPPCDLRTVFELKGPTKHCVITSAKAVDLSIYYIQSQPCLYVSRRGSLKLALFFHLLYYLLS